MAIRKISSSGSSGGGSVDSAVLITPFFAVTRVERREDALLGCWRFAFAISLRGKSPRGDGRRRCEHLCRVPAADRSRSLFALAHESHALPSLCSGPRASLQHSHVSLSLSRSLFDGLITALLWPTSRSRSLSLPPFATGRTHAPPARLSSQNANV